MSKLGVIKLAWMVLGFLVAVPLVVTYNATTSRDNDILLGYALLVLTFPIGIAVAALHAPVGYILSALFSVQFPAGRRGMMFEAVVFWAAGYLQWFVVVPAICGQVETLRSNSWLTLSAVTFIEVLVGFGNDPHCVGQHNRV